MVQNGNLINCDAVLLDIQNADLVPENLTNDNDIGPAEEKYKYPICELGGSTQPMASSHKIRPAIARALRACAQPTKFCARVRARGAKPES